VDSGPGVFDHELDSQPRSPLRPLNESIVLYQRLVVNPFLAVLALVIIVAIGPWVEARQSFGSFQAMLAVFAVKFLVQYHCRDCGATGFLTGSRKHVCPAVLARWHQYEMPRFRGPSVNAQYVLWLILLASVFILALVAWSAA
jgi:hypothetical protein